MKALKATFILAAILTLVLISCSSDSEVVVVEKEEGQGTFKITSPFFKHNEFIPSKYTCQGLDINPELTFEDIPKNTESLVLIVDDPDASEETWVHWVLFNIPAVDRIVENSAPENSVQGRNSWESPGYKGPCPPSGEHRYFFKAYALDSVLELDKNADKNAVEAAMQGHILGEATLIGVYRKI